MTISLKITMGTLDNGN